MQVGNALEELEGKELKAATDATCSRILEALVMHAAPDDFARLMKALTDGQEWCMLAARYADVSHTYPLCHWSLPRHVAFQQPLIVKCQ